MLFTLWIQIALWDSLESVGSIFGFGFEFGFVGCIFGFAQPAHTSLQGKLPFSQVATQGWSWI